MPKQKLLIISLIVIIATAFVTLLLNRGGQTISKTEIDIAVNQAKLLYRQRQERGEDFTNGPCLSNALMPNWVVDIVHNPRVPLDDLPQNQCAAYSEGRASHFVELDPKGNLIRAR